MTLSVTRCFTINNGKRQRPGGVLQQPHGSDVVLCGVVLVAAQGGGPEVQGGRIRQQCNHAGEVLDKETIHDLLQEALEGGQLGVTQLPEEVLVEYHLLCCARGGVIVGHLLGISHQPLHARSLL